MTLPSLDTVNTILGRLSMLEDQLAALDTRVSSSAQAYDDATFAMEDVANNVLKKLNLIEALILKGSNNVESNQF